MSAKPLGPSMWITDTVTDTREREPDAKDRFVACYGQMIKDLHEHLLSIEDPDMFYRLGEALVAVVGVATEERLKGLKKDVQ